MTANMYMMKYYISLYGLINYPEQSPVHLSGDVGGADICFHAKIFNA